MDIRTFMDIVEINNKLYANKEIDIEFYKRTIEILLPKIVDTWEGFRVEADNNNLMVYMYHHMIHLKDKGILTLDECKELRKNYI